MSILSLAATRQMPLQRINQRFLKGLVTVHCAKLSNNQQDLIGGKRYVLADKIKDFERHKLDFPAPADSPSGRMASVVALFLQQETDKRNMYGIR